MPNKGVSPSMSGLSWFGVEATASLPSLPTWSQAQPEPAGRRRLGEGLLEGGEPAQLARDRLRQRPGRLTAAARLHDQPEERVVGVPAAVIPHRGPDALGQGGEVPDQFLDRLALMIG